MRLYLVYPDLVNKAAAKSSLSGDESVQEFTDSELVERAKAGEHGAFRELYEKYNRRAYAVALGVLRNQEEALEVVQEGFVKAYKNLEKFKGNSSFYTWLYRIVMNLCIDKTRRRKRVRQVEFEEAARTLGHDSTTVQNESLLPNFLGQDPSRTFARKEIREQIGSALAQLSESHRTVLVMREIDGMSYDEMAKLMECSKGTIMSRLFHARKNMQKLLQDFVGAEKDLKA